MSYSVMVIDTDIGVVKAFKTALPRWGFLVAGFTSMARGFEALKKEKPQALILDIQLSKPQSISLLREAKKLYASVPIIVITAYSTSFTEAQAIREGADGYFVKPIDLHALVRKLEAVINSTKMNVVENLFIVG
ncbi:MAG: response regulator [candidate division KSB1 bacterium]|nr:response regulator [candidate division KSB1 bacterium]